MPPTNARTREVRTRSNDDDGGNIDTLILEDDEDGDGDANASENAAEQAANVGADSDEPGQPVTHFRPNGTFSMRGTLVSADEGSLTALTSVQEEALTLQFADVTITLPAENGNPNDAEPETPVSLNDFGDYIVFFTGVCTYEPNPNEEEDPFNIAEDCTVDRVTVLGRAGQGGQPEDAGQPDVLPSNAPEDAGQPENPGQPDVQPNSGQQPVDAGKPASTSPAAAQGGNPNSD